MIPNANMEFCEYDHNVYVIAILSSLILTSASLREHIDNNMWMQGIHRHSLNLPLHFPVNQLDVLKNKVN